MLLDGGLWDSKSLHDAHFFAKIVYFTTASSVYFAGPQACNFGVNRKRTNMLNMTMPLINDIAYYVPPELPELLPPDL